MSPEVGRIPVRLSDPAPASAGAEATDTGLMCLLILARFYDLPADALAKLAGADKIKVSLDRPVIEDRKSVV